MTITQTVAAHLAGQSAAYIEDIAAHGIHNITNDFQGNSDDEYQAYSDEFKRQAVAAGANTGAPAIPANRYVENVAKPSRAP
jgi:hypothetical protein